LRKSWPPTPHVSAAEFAELAGLLEEPAPFADNVEFWVSTSRHVLEQAERAGQAAVCRAAGARIVVDTCTYVTPLLRPSA
jgi:predicted aconitase